MMNLATSLSLFLYRLVNEDADGAVMDFGNVFASNFTHAAYLVREKLSGLVPEITSDHAVFLTPVPIAESPRVCSMNARQRRIALDRLPPAPHIDTPLTSLEQPSSAEQLVVKSIVGYPDDHHDFFTVEDQFYCTQQIKLEGDVWVIIPPQP